MGGKRGCECFLSLLVFFLELAFAQLFGSIGSSIGVKTACRGSGFGHFAVVPEETAHTIDQGSAVGVTKQL